MPNERNFYLKENNGKLVEEPLLVTISLEEYRSLVRENTKYIERIAYLESRLLEFNKPKEDTDND